MTINMIVVCGFSKQSSALTKLICQDPNEKYVAPIPAKLLGKFDINHKRNDYVNVKRTIYIALLPPIV